MSANDAIDNVRRRPTVPGGMENPTESLSHDPAIPDRTPMLGAKIAMDTPEVRMAVRNEARAKVMMSNRETTLINSKVELIT